MPGGRARSALSAGAGARFADVHWVAETGSTNADALALARDGAPEGVVVVADHQTAGRGRAGRSWTAPPGASLLMSVLLRPPVEVVGLCTVAMAVATAEAVEEVAGFSPRVKWPNDLVWPGEGSDRDRKLAGILAEADWPTTGVPRGVAPPATDRHQRGMVVIGMGINVTWPAELPADLERIAIACNHVSAAPVDREDLLVSVLRRLDVHYSALLDDDRASLLDSWRARSATLGAQVRVDLGGEEIVGTATHLSDDGHLVVTTGDGPRTVAVGDVVHARPM